MYKVKQGQWGTQIWRKWGCSVSVKTCNQTHGKTVTGAAAVLDCNEACSSTYLTFIALPVGLTFFLLTLSFRLFHPLTIFHSPSLYVWYYQLPPPLIYSSSLVHFLCRHGWLFSFTLFPPFPTILMYRSQQIKQNPSINTSLDHLISQIAAERSALGEVFSLLGNIT